MKTEDLLLWKPRSIGGVIPNVVISEEHVDEVIVTEHPVDTGAPVADHAYVKPGSVVAKFGWSDTERPTFMERDGDSDEVLRVMRDSKEAYEVLLSMMRLREPIVLVTGKRRYPSVLITKLQTLTDVNTQNCLIIEVTFTEVRRADFGYASLSPQDPSLGEKSNNGAYALKPGGNGPNQTGGVVDVSSNNTQTGQSAIPTQPQQ